MLTFYERSDPRRPGCPDLNCQSRWRPFRPMRGIRVEGASVGGALHAIDLPNRTAADGPDRPVASVMRSASASSGAGAPFVVESRTSASASCSERRRSGHGARRRYARGTPPRTRARTGRRAVPGGPRGRRGGAACRQGAGAVGGAITGGLAGCRTRAGAAPRPGLAGRRLEPPESGPIGLRVQSRKRARPTSWLTSQDRSEHCDGSPIAVPMCAHTSADSAIAVIRFAIVFSFLAMTVGAPFRTPWSRPWRRSASLRTPRRR